MLKKKPRKSLTCRHPNWMCKACPCNDWWSQLLAGETSMHSSKSSALQQLPNLRLCDRSNQAKQCLVAWPTLIAALRTVVTNFGVPNIHRTSQPPLVKQYYWKKTVCMRRGNSISLQTRFLQKYFLQSLDYIFSQTSCAFFWNDFEWLS